MKYIRMVMVPVSRLKNHPDNPRKDIGDVSELAESLRKNGVMQNLTILPVKAREEELENQPDVSQITLEDDFYVLIGNRRMTAAKEAGLIEVPCNIVSQISLKDQIGIMMTENLQREDLSIYEQASGFQRMIDLGYTEDTVAEKTGFSKQTVKHRLNIAKLDQGVLQEKEKEESFQLSLKVLYELEKVDDLEKRNEMLKRADNNNDLYYRVKTYLRGKKKEEQKKRLIEYAEKQGIEPAPQRYENERYTSKWKVIKKYSYDKEGLPERIEISKDEKIYYSASWDGIEIVKKQKVEKREITEEEKKQQERRKKKSEIKETLEKMNSRRKDFVMDILLGERDGIAKKEEAEVKDMIWEALEKNGGSIYESSIEDFLLEKSRYQCSDEELKAVQERKQRLSVLERMLIVLSQAMNYPGELPTYDCRFNEKAGFALREGYKVLEKFGWYYEEGEREILNGSSSLYEKEEV